MLKITMIRDGRGGPMRHSLRNTAAGRFRAAAARLTPESLRESGLYKWTAEGDGLGAGMAEMDFGTAPVVAEALIAAVHKGTVGYPTPGFEAEVRRACARWQAAEYGWEVPQDAVRVLPDVVRAYQPTARS